MGNFGASITGLDAVTTRLNSLVDSTRLAAEVAVFDEGAAILVAAQEAVPVDSGELRDSGAMSNVIDDGSVIYVEIGFGAGISAPYAAAIHETPSAYDPPSWKATPPHFTQGGPKYLERPLLAASTGMAERIAAKIKSIVK